MYYKIFPVLMLSCIFCRELTFNDLLLQAMKHNPELKAAAESVHAAEQNITVKGSLPNPMLTGGYFQNPVVTKEGPQAWKIGLSQSVPYFGKLSLKKKIAKQHYSLQEIEMKNRLLNIQSRVWQAFEALRKYRNEMDILLQSLDLSRHLEAVILSGYKTSTTGHPNLVQIQLRIIKLENRLEDLNQQHRILWNELEYAVGTRVSDSLSFSSIDVSTKNDWSIINNSDILKAEAQANIYENKYHLARYEILPDFIVGMDYIKLDTQKAGTDPIMLKLGLSLPIWFGKTAGIKNNSKHEWNGMKFIQQDTEIRIEMEKESLMNEIDDFRRKIIMYNQQLIPQAQQGYDAAETAYIAGNLSFTDFNSIFQTLIDLRLEAVNADYLYQMAQAKKYKITGQLLTGLYGSNDDE